MQPQLCICITLLVNFFARLFPRRLFLDVKLSAKESEKEKTGKSSFSLPWSLALRHQAFALAFVDRWRTKYEDDAPEAEEEAVSSVKSSCPVHRCRKTKDFFVFCSGKNLLGIVSWFLLYCFTSFVSGARNKCLLTLNCLISLLLRALTWDNGFFFLLFFSEHR